MITDEAEAVRVANEKGGQHYDRATLSESVSQVIGMKVWRLQQDVADPILGSKPFIAEDGTLFSGAVRQMTDEERDARLKESYNQSKAAASGAEEHPAA